MLGLKVRDFAVWLLYCAMLAIVVPWHEPWSDEAQAWLLARDLSIPQLLFHNLRYESHPALWYLILWGPAHLHLPYAVMAWISAAIAAAGIYVLLRLAPFPFYLRAVLPFTFFLAYQFAVVARSYVLFPLLCFLIAHVYRAAARRPVLMAGLLALLANVSVHGTLVACAMGAVYAWNLFGERQTQALPPRPVAGAAALFVASVVLVGITIRPPAHLRTVATPAVTNAIHFRFPFGHSHAAQPVSPVTQAPAAAPDDGAAAPDGGAAANAADGAVTAPMTLKDRLLERLADFPRVLSYSISSSPLLALVVYLYVVVFLYARGQLLLLAPLVVLAAFLGLIYAREWHLGLLWVVLLMIVWAAWDTSADHSGLTLQNALAALLIFVSVLQFPWTWDAVRYDLRHQYYPATETAAYLHTLPPGERIAGFGDVNTVLPYFRRNIFYNLQTSYNPNRTDDTTFADAPRTIGEHPDMIVAWWRDYGILAIARADGYHETHRFCGRLFMPDMNVDESCYLILQPETKPQPAK